MKYGCIFQAEPAEGARSSLRTFLNAKSDENLRHFFNTKETTSKVKARTLVAALV